ncbi:MAG: hypothetical protein K0R61_2722 [Microvirga sp.]|nr:hypothetical protein [Microvirga sp.]
MAPRRPRSPAGHESLRHATRCKAAMAALPRQPASAWSVYGLPRAALRYCESEPWSFALAIIPNWSRS